MSNKLFCFLFCKEVFEVQPGKFVIGKLRLHYENVKALYFVKVSFSYLVFPSLEAVRPRLHDEKVAKHSETPPK